MNHQGQSMPDDGDPWAQNNLLTPEQKKNKTPVEPRWAKQTRSSGPNQQKLIALSGTIIESDARPTGVQLKKAAWLSTIIGLKVCIAILRMKLI